MKVDIHKYKERLEAVARQINKSDKISNKNKTLLLKFRDCCMAEGLSCARVSRLIQLLKQIVILFLDKDFDKCNKDDIQKLMSKIQQKDYSPWTVQLYKVTIKKFYRWLRKTEEYPEEVRWINTNIKKSEINLPGEGELLTEEEIKKLIENAEHPRDKALISILYESGCRIGEILSMKKSNLVFDKNGAVIIVKGKTGSRKIRLVSSTSYLVTWYESHPVKDKESPLWINIGVKNHNKQLYYTAMRNFLRRLFNKTGINKRYNPHLFRHSRATYLANYLTEFQMNQYFGWVQGSDMPSTYVHLTGKNVDGAILELNGINLDKTEKKESKLKPKRCPRCDTINSFNSKYCTKCACILDIQTAMELEEDRKYEYEFFNGLMEKREFWVALIKKLEDMGISEKVLKV